MTYLWKLNGIITEICPILHHTYEVLRWNSYRSLTSEHTTPTRHRHPCPLAGFEPATPGSERPQTSRAATAICTSSLVRPKILLSFLFCTEPPPKTSFFQRNVTKFHTHAKREKSKATQLLILMFLDSIEEGREVGDFK